MFQAGDQNGFTRVPQIVHGFSEDRLLFASDGRRRRRSWRRHSSREPKLFGYDGGERLSTRLFRSGERRQTQGGAVYCQPLSQLATHVRRTARGTGRKEESLTPNLLSPVERALRHAFTKRARSARSTRLSSTELQQKRRRPNFPICGVFVFNRSDP